MNLPVVLFVPDRFRDYRMWYDIPDRIQGRSEVIHFDQHDKIPWAADNAEFVNAARRLAPDGGFDVVAAAGAAARFGFALGEVDLTKSVVFFQPTLDSIPDDVRVDLSGLDGALEAYEPLVNAIHDPDLGRLRDMLLQVVRDTAGPDRDSAGLELEIAMMRDHADEFLAHLRATAVAADGGFVPPDQPWMERPWIDRLSQLSMPVTAIGSGPFEQAIARRAANAEIVVAAGNGGMAPAADRALAAEALLRMLGRVG